MSAHPWKLVGPWYRQESVGGPVRKRHSAPIFQKYASSDFSERLLDEPQASLKFISEDFVNRVDVDPFLVVTPELKQASSETLKFFLDLHSRFYVVMCELHCDVPGFPSADRKQVSEAGFVIRRLVPKVGGSVAKSVNKIMAQRHLIKTALLKAEADNQQIQNQTNSISGLIKSKSKELTSGFKNNKVEKLKQEFELNSQALDDLVVTGELSLERQGWINGDLKTVGQWEKLDELKPQEIEEQVIPMYPLIADPTAEQHSAEGKSLWFGVIPTGSADTDTDGNPKFDDSDLYEIQCFVKRKNKENCCEETFWSEATESYRVASAYDLDGGSHKPINIKLPNLDALKAQASLGPPGQGANTRMIAPENSALNFNTNEMDMPEPGNPRVRESQQICFFAILLFFLVALFLFRLILPIFMFLFQLWFLLTLRLCIPPSFGIDADLAVELKIKGPELEAKFELDAGFEVEVGGEIFNNDNKDDLKEKIAESVALGLNVSDSFRNDINDGLLDSLSLDELAEIYISMATDFEEDPEHEELAGELPKPERGLVYFEPVGMSS